MKKLICILLAFTLAFSLCACGSSTPKTEDSANATQEGSADTAQTYTLTISSHMPTEDVGSMFLTEFADLVEERSGGRITFERYYNSQLATQAESAEAVKLGTIDIVCNDFPTMASANGYSKGAVMALSYLFDGYEHVRAFAESMVRAMKAARRRKSA